MNVTVAPSVAGGRRTAVGAPGVRAIVTAFDGADGGPVPAAFVAVTVNVYVEPSVRPVTTIGLELPTRSRRRARRPRCRSSTGPGGGVKLTLAVPFPAAAETPVGAAGAGGPEHPDRAAAAVVAGAADQRGAAVGRQRDACRRRRGARSRRCR